MRRVHCFRGENDGIKGSETLESGGKYYNDDMLCRSDSSVLLLIIASFTDDKNGDSKRIFLFP